MTFLLEVKVCYVGSLNPWNCFWDKSILEHLFLPAFNLVFKVVKVVLKIMYFFGFFFYNFSIPGVLFEQVIYTFPAVQNTEIIKFYLGNLGFYNDRYKIF